ncbi:hypothetical protein ACOMHN_023485 [Nucella lapillus]
MASTHQRHRGQKEPDSPQLFASQHGYLRSVLPEASFPGPITEMMQNFLLCLTNRLFTTPVVTEMIQNYLLCLTNRLFTAPVVTEMMLLQSSQR